MPTRIKCRDKPPDRQHAIEYQVRKVLYQNRERKRPARKEFYQNREPQARREPALSVLGLRTPALRSRLAFCQRTKHASDKDSHSFLFR